MEEFLEFTTALDDLSVASPKRGYGLSVGRESVWAVDVGSGSASQSESQVSSDVIEVTGTLNSTGRTVKMYLDTSTKRGNKKYRVVFSVVAGSGGPYVVTFSTGLANRTNVSIPVIPSTHALTSPKFMSFELYVDGLGNVSCGCWEISVAVTGAGYRLSSDGWAECWWRDPSTSVLAGSGTSLKTVTFPITFSEVPVVDLCFEFVSGSYATLDSGDANRTVSGTTLRIYVYLGGANAVAVRWGYRAKGKYKINN